MVSKQIGKRKTIIVVNILLIIFIISGIVVYGLMLKNYLDNKPIREDNISAEDDVDTSASKTPEKTEVEIAKVNFQPMVDDWVKTVGGNKSIVIYDLDRDEMSASYNAGENYNTASLYKLFVVYEGYQRVQNGEWQGGAMAGSTGYTINQCLDKAIRESHSPCAETLWGMIGHAELDEITKNNFGILNSQISTLTSNAPDIMAMLKIFYNHTEIKDENLLAQMKDSFLNQPKTTYDWRQGLPSGFSKAKVYNKVGWDYNPNGGYWNIYHDAAIVEFPESNRHFIIVVMTNRVPFQQIRTLGTSLENAFYNN